MQFVRLCLARRSSLGAFRAWQVPDEFQRPDGGYAFNTTHNVQARVPKENLLALYEAVREFGKYPLN